MRTPRADRRLGAARRRARRRRLRRRRAPGRRRAVGHLQASRSSSARVPRQRSRSPQTRADASCACATPTRKATPNVAVTVETDPAHAGDAHGRVRAARRRRPPRRPRAARVDRRRAARPAATPPPTQHVGARPRSAPARRKTFVWKVTAVQAGDYTIRYRVAPGLTGKAKLASGGAPDGHVQGPHRRQAGPRARGRQRQRRPRQRRPGAAEVVSAAAAAR